MDGRVKKNSKNLKGHALMACSLKAHQLMDTLVQTWSTKRYYSASVPVKGKLLLVLGEAMEWWQQTLPLVTMYAADGDGSISRSSSIGVIITPPWHRRHLTPMALEALTILTEAVFGCATFNSPMHDNREVVLAVGGYEQSHCSQVLDYSQPKSQHGQQVITIHLYDCFIWLFCTIAWNHHILPKNYVVFYPASKRLMCAFCNLCESKSILADLQLINIDLSIDM